METQKTSKSENRTLAVPVHALSMAKESWLIDFLYFDPIHKTIERKWALG